MRRVVISGIGLVTPLGIGTAETWQQLVAGRSAVGPITSYDATSLRTQLGAEVLDLDPKRYVRNRRSLRTMTRYDVMTVVGAGLAAENAGPEFEDDAEGRAALFTASNKEISKPEHFEEVAIAVRDRDGAVDMRRFGEVSREVHPLFFIEGLQGASLFYISEALALRGANTYFAGTSEASAIAVGRAFRAIRRGEADVALAGGGDAPVCWWNMAKTDSLEILTAHNELGARACRPYDRRRDGAVFGEGGAFLVLETLEGARRRDARVYAEVTGFGSSMDTHGIITPDPFGRPLARAIGAALREARWGPQDVGYVASHGSGTRLGDASEGRALRDVFAGAPNGMCASSVKPATGHLVAAAGALNVAVAALAVHEGVVPPTLNLEELDPACAGTDWTADGARERRVSRALALARGLEGQNVAVAVGEP
jgi:3-oxoacyl-[acyl-carrier-protein] synthase II